MINYKPEKFIEYVRDGLVEQEHSGILVKINSDKSVHKIGDDNGYPFYFRSCAKPLQAALIIDFGLDEAYGMTTAEIAVCCASHSGESCHIEAVKSILNKIGLDDSFHKCGAHQPLSAKAQRNLILAGEAENVLHNNCSGKHAMMLAICKKMGWDLSNYDEIGHPLQIAIKEKIYSLCELKKEYPATKDGCGVPIYSLPLENMVRGYLNLFLDPKYSKIKEAFIEHPYLIGGEKRIDTAIMSANKKLISKIGAGGLCTVLNLETKEALIVKIMDCDLKARSISVIGALKELNWLDDTMLEHDLIKFQNQRDILTWRGDKIGEINFVISDLLNAAGFSGSN